MTTPSGAGAPSAQTAMHLRRQTAPAREQYAVRLRLMGRTYADIAASLLPCPEHRPDGWAGCPACQPLYGSPASARRAIERALRRDYAHSPAERELLRTHQIGQLDMLLRTMMRDAITSTEAADRARAAGRATELLDRRAKLLGLDAPTRITVTDELDAEIEQLMHQLADQARAEADQQPHD